MVGRKGLEPSHLAAREPKSRVSTNSTTGPLIFRFYVELNKLTTRNIVFLNNGANEGIRTPDIGHHKPAL